jgi:single-stranded DNA-binding protein
MLDCLVAGRLIKKPELKTSGKGTPYCNLLVSCSTGEAESTVITGVAFNDIAERLSKLDKGDSVSLVGSLRPTEYEKNGEKKHGLSVTVNQLLSIYDIKRRRPKTESGQQSPAHQGQPFNDDILF